MYLSELVVWGVYMYVGGGEVEGGVGGSII